MHGKGILELELELDCVHVVRKALGHIFVHLQQFLPVRQLVFSEGRVNVAIHQLHY